jgi:hypothetical protein
MVSRDLAATFRKYDSNNISVKNDFMAGILSHKSLYIFQRGEINSTGWQVFLIVAG